MCSECQVNNSKSTMPMIGTLSRASGSPGSSKAMPKRNTSSALIAFAELDEKIRAAGISCPSHD